MSKFLIVMKREYAQVVKKKSFLIMTLLTPVIMTALMTVPSLLIHSGTADAETYAIIDRDGNQLGDKIAQEMTSYELDDEGTLAYQLDAVDAIPPDDEARFEEVYQAQVQRIRDDELHHLLILNAEPQLADSNILLITNTDAPRVGRRLEYQLTNLLAERRIAESGLDLTPDSVLALTRGVDITVQDTKGVSINPAIKLLAAMILVMLIYMLILIDGSTLMRSVIEEKTSRIVEVLMSSASPFQLMAGKIVGTGLAALTQVGIWVVCGAVLMMFAPSTGSGVETAIISILTNPATVVSFVGFLLFGYLMYSTIFAFIGSIVNSDKEAQTLMMPVVFILFLPAMMVAPVTIEFGDPTWLQVMSFIPTYTPLVMMMRVAVAAPTIEGNALFSSVMGEALLGMLGIILTTVFLVWITSKVFRVGILMYGKRPTLPELIKWIRH